MEKYDAAERFKSLMLYGTGLAVVLSVTGVCAWVVVSPRTEYAFSWATVTLSTITTSIIAAVYKHAAAPAGGQGARRTVARAGARKGLK